MTQLTLSDISKAMADIDFAMLSTRTEGGAIAARPMSNNGDVAYDGDSFFFTYEAARTVADIERDPKVGLSFQGKAGLLGKPPMFIAVEGTAELIRDKAAFEAHWTKDLDYWFDKGIDTPGIVLVKVHAGRIHYWNGRDEGEIAL
ncbi:pyridoxamine 5'-phosphate oxidase family protein [Aurantimonas sp. Leaf443]|uniref:pyridoxamine 5'-phosphate oxidase family protein n=1 Tax=Aurantimonas sp. Leaf443 TaxID=1736378 RepID=UPI0007003E27|nr:pyridoxamine 5'-phosphate oxidase family protein [Aurantimonas sp. Leaf443]KQT85430.1 pyridoxamine 5'-phosphate oxidase [Aurantimonas sp. Leaf443]